jgi:hypothetical protein
VCRLDFHSLFEPTQLYYFSNLVPAGFFVFIGIAKIPAKNVENFLVVESGKKWKK